MQLPVATPHASPAGELHRADFAAGDVEHPLDLGDARRRWPDPLADRAAGQHQGHRGERSSRHRSIDRHHAASERIEILGLVAQDLGLASEERHEVTTGAAREQWDHVMADPVAPECAVVVARVTYRLEAELRAERLGLGPPQLQHRADDACSGRRHPAQAGGAAASEQVEQHRLRLIVSRVPDEDRGRSGRCPSGFERGVPRGACARLLVRTRHDLHPLRAKRHAEPGGMRSNDLVLTRTFNSKTVINVDGDRVQPARVCQRQQGE